MPNRRRSMRIASHPVAKMEESDDDDDHDFDQDVIYSEQKPKRQRLDSENEGLNQGVQTQWFTDFPWLLVEDNALKCTTCICTKKTNLLTVGKDFSARKPKRDDLVKHEKTYDHVEAVSELEQKEEYKEQQIVSPVPSKKLTQWCADFPWLFNDGLILKCKLCVDSHKSNIFAKGKEVEKCKRDFLVQHEKNNEHKQAVAESDTLGQPENSIESENDLESSTENHKQCADVPRTVKQSWFEDFPWLLVDDDVLKCRQCFDAMKSNIFTSGKEIKKCRRFDLVKHEQSSDHRQASDGEEAGNGVEYGNVDDLETEDESIAYGNLNFASAMKQQWFVHTTVQQQWFSDFPWLIVDGGFLKCRLCIDAQKNNIFTTGKDMTRPKRFDLVQHQKIIDHRQAAKQLEGHLENSSEKGSELLIQNVKHGGDSDFSPKPKWFTDFPWLLAEGEVLKCSFCLFAQKTNIFTRGKDANSTKRDHLAQHEKNNDHMEASTMPPSATSFEYDTEHDDSGMIAKCVPGGMQPHLPAGVQSQWFTDFPWMLIEDGLLKCTYCINASKSNIFTTGKNLSKPKRDNLTKHEKTVDHRDALRLPLLNDQVGYDEDIISNHKLKQEGDWCRSIQHQWFVDFPWLLVDDVGMKCSFCIDAEKNNIFTSGKDMNRPKRDDLVKHEKTTDHKEAILTPEVADQFKYHRVKNLVICQMATLLVQAREAIPASKNRDLIELQIFNGVLPLTGLLTQDWLDVYSETDFINDMYKALATVVKQDLEMERQGSHVSFFSLAVDVASDVANHPVIFVYLRFLGSDIRVRTQLIGASRLQTATDEKVYRGINRIIAENGLDASQMVGLCIDGVPEMQDICTAVASRFKQNHPHIVSTQCMAHRLELKVEKAASHVPYLLEYRSVLDQFSRTLKFSPSFHCVLEANLDQQEDKTMKERIREVFSEKNISFCKTVQTISGCLETIHSSLHEALVLDNMERKPVLQYLLDKMSSYTFIMMTHFLADAVNELETVSESLNKEDINFSEIIPKFKDAQVAIQELLKSQLSNTEKTATDSVETSVDSRVNSALEAKSTQSTPERENFEKIAKAFIDELLENLDTSFPDSDALESFRILDPRYNSTDESQLNILLQWFNEFIDVALAQEEWLQLKEVLSKEEYRHLDLEGFYQCFLLDNFPSYPNIGKLAGIILSIPVSSPLCKKGLSVYARISGHATECFSDIVEEVVTLSLHSQPLNAFHFEAAFRNWTVAMEMKKALALQQTEDDQTGLDLNGAAIGQLWYM